VSAPPSRVAERPARGYLTSQKSKRQALVL
jgi:hypothetical protein